MYLLYMSYLGHMGEFLGDKLPGYSPKGGPLELLTLPVEISQMPRGPPTCFPLPPRRRGAIGAAPEYQNEVWMDAGETYANQSDW